MANLKPEEYINIQFPNSGYELISAVRVDSPTSKWKPTVQRVVVLIKVAKKKAMTATLWTNEFESDGTTLKKQDTGYYFNLEDGCAYDKSKSEMETLVSDKQEQLKILNRRIAEINGGGWVITQDPWDPNVVPKSLAPDEPVKTTVTEKPIVQADTSGTSGTSIQTEPQIYGEFTFNVEDAFLFKGNQDFDLLEILYKGLTKEEVEVIEEEEIDEEYEETDYAGDELYDLQLQSLSVITSEAFKENPDLKAIYDGKDVISDEVEIKSSSVKVTKGDAADFWALIAICCTEDAGLQPRADVAQAIYNRLISGLYGGKSIKEIVTNPGQFEPAFNKTKKSETHPTWLAISSKETCIAALKYTKGWKDDTCLTTMKEAYKAISGLSYQKEARASIANRSDFLGVGKGETWYKGTGEWKKGKSSTVPFRRTSTNNIFANIYPGSYTWGFGKAVDKKDKKSARIIQIGDPPNDLFEKFKF